MKTKTKIGKQIKRKTNPELVETIKTTKKNKGWIEVAAILSGPRRYFANLNLGEIDNQAKDGEIIVIPGKVLSQGEVTKKIKITALNFSGKAKEKLEKGKISYSRIIEEIKKNPEDKSFRILKGK
jgi:large subunit ribosomal protein L18e